MFVFATLDPEHWQQNIFIPALYAYLFVVFIWGNYAISNAAGNDVGINTWDFQKMSSIGPWELTIGKLFGSTSFTWYTSAFLLTLLAYCYSYTEDNLLERSIFTTFSTPTKPIIYLILAGAIGHAISFLATSTNTKRKKNSISAGFILGCAASYGVLRLIINTNNGVDATINWHFWEINQNTFITLSLLYFVFWTIIAIQRNMRDELQFKNTPFVLLMFIIGICLYITGYADLIMQQSKNMKIAIYSNNSAPYNEDMFIVKLTISFLILAFSTYILAFKDANNLSKYKRWIYAFKYKEWKRFLKNTPAWVGCAALLLLVYFTLMSKLSLTEKEIIQNFAFTTAILLFIARDGLIYHSILIGKIERHKAFTVGLYILMIYTLIPLTLLALAKTFEADWTVARIIASSFYPIPTDSLLLTITPIIYQTIIAIAILYFVVKSLKDKKTPLPAIYKNR